jgi:hypothetical protein
MSLLVPNLSAPLTDSYGLIKSQAWISFFQQFVQAPSGTSSLIVGASPFAYQAKEPGLVNVGSGVVSHISLTRGSTIIDVTGLKLIPVAIKDTVTVTYSVLPTILFIPNY